MWQSLVFLFLPYLPSSNVLVLVGFVIAERNLYLSVVGYAILIASGIRILHKQRPVSTKIFFSITLTFFIAKSIHRGFEWRSEEVLFHSGLKVCPTNAKVHYNVAKISHDPQVAIKYYRQAIELWPTYEHAMNNLGNVLKNQGSCDPCPAYIWE